jgi:hypothetical protein
MCDGEFESTYVVEVVGAMEELVNQRTEAYSDERERDSERDSERTRMEPKMELELDLQIAVYL